MTPFQLKRLEHLQNVAKKGEFVQLGAGDAEIFKKCAHNHVMKVADKIMEENKELFQDLAKAEEKDKYCPKIGDKIRILEEDANCTDTNIGDFLIIKNIDNGRFKTDRGWCFDKESFDNGEFEFVEE